MDNPTPNLEDKFEKVRKAVIEQHNRIDPIQQELLSNRSDFAEMERAIRGLKLEVEGLHTSNDLILKTLKEIIVKEKEKKQKKTFAFFLKTCYTKFVNLFK